MTVYWSTLLWTNTRENPKFGLLWTNWQMSNLSQCGRWVLKKKNCAAEHIFLHPDGQKLPQIPSELLLLTTLWVFSHASSMAVVIAVHHFGPDWKVSIDNKWIPRKTTFMVPRGCTFGDLLRFRLVPFFEWNIPITIGWIAVKFGSHICNIITDDLMIQLESSGQPFSLPCAGLLLDYIPAKLTTFPFSSTLCFLLISKC